MAKYLLFLLIPIIGNSQPVMTNSIAPNFGDQYDAQFIDNPNFDPGPEGANQTWDFSNLQGQFEIHFNILDPNDAPESDHFPDASFVWNIVEFETFFFYTSSEEGISQMGNSVANENETTFLVINSDLEDALQFPVTFGTSYDYHTEYSNYLFGNLLSSGQRDGTLTADAYGTIMTPFGTFDNTLRVKLVTTEFGFNTTQYAWYDVDNFIPILVYETSEDPEETPSLYYTEIKEVLATEETTDSDTPSIYYSYESNSIVIQYSTQKIKIGGLQLFSIDGNLIQKDDAFNLNNSSGKIEFKLKNSTSNGIFILRYLENDIPRSAPIYIGR